MPLPPNDIDRQLEERRASSEDVQSDDSSEDQERVHKTPDQKAVQNRMIDQETIHRG